MGSSLCVPLPRSRWAKRKLDNAAFYGGVLRVRYAPEFETLEDVRAKLLDRRRTIARLLRPRGPARPAPAFAPAAHTAGAATTPGPRCVVRAVVSSLAVFAKD